MEPIHVVCPHCDTTNRVPRERLGEGAVCGKCKEPLFDGRVLAPSLVRWVRRVARPG